MATGELSLFHDFVQDMYKLEERVAVLERLINTGYSPPHETINRTLPDGCKFTNCADTKEHVWLKMLETSDVWRCKLCGMEMAGK